MDGTSSKLPTTPPLPLPRHFPQRGQRGLRGAPPPAGAARRLGSPMGELSSKARLRGCPRLSGNMYRSQPSTVTPFAASRHFPQRGQQGKLGSPVGELSSKARLRGCCSLDGTSSKLPTTPPLPLPRHFPQRGQRGLRGAPPPAGAARRLGSPMGELSSKARLRGCPRLSGNMYRSQPSNNTPFAASRHETEV